jgi:hypothetical protein
VSKTASAFSPIPFSVTSSRAIAISILVASGRYVLRPFQGHSGSQFARPFEMAESLMSLRMVRWY